MCQKKEQVLSALHHTWILDLDGSLARHNGYQEDGDDAFVDGALDFLCSLPKEDVVIVLTSRAKADKQQAIEFVRKNHIRCDCIIFDAPHGERILE